MNADSIEFKREFVEVCKLMADRRLVAGTEGNVSGRATDGTIIMTPSGYNLADVTADMLAALDLHERANTSDNRANPSDG